MSGSNNAIQSLLGTAKADTTQSNAKSNPSLKAIASNGKYLIQNVSQLASKLNDLGKKWGA